MADKERKPENHEQQPTMQQQVLDGKKAKVAPDADRLRLTEVYRQPATLLRPSPTLDQLVKDCVYVLDTSCLLSPFDGGSETLNEFARILADLTGTGRIRVPAQALREYVNRRSSKIAEIYNNLKQKVSRVQGGTKIDIRLIQSMERHDKINKQMEAFNRAADAYRKELQALITEVQGWNWSDPVTSLYHSVLQPDIIVESGETVESIQADFRRRVENNIPPVGSDADKTEGIGDTVIWHAMLRVGRELKKNVVFVCNETKADMWVRSGSDAIAVRHELLYEFYHTTNQDFGICDFAEFLKLNGAKQEVVTEAKNVVAEEKEQAAVTATVPVTGQKPASSGWQALEEIGRDFLNSDAPSVMKAIRNQLAAYLNDPNATWIGDDFNKQYASFQVKVPTLRKWHVVWKTKPDELDRLLEQLHAVYQLNVTYSSMNKFAQRRMRAVIRDAARRFVQWFDESALCRF